MNEFYGHEEHDKTLMTESLTSSIIVNQVQIKNPRSSILFQFETMTLTYLAVKCYNISDSHKIRETTAQNNHS